MTEHVVSITVNEETHVVKIPTKRLLADVLRDDLLLTGTKRGCETGVCGACSVLVDGEVTKSCLSLAVQANGRRITTVEGLASGEKLHPLQLSFMEKGGLQCGYCTPGFLMAAHDLLNQNPDPSEDEIREGLNGNICRCTGYQGIVDSIKSAVEKMHGR